METEVKKMNSVQLLLGEVYAEQERYPEAISIYEEATAADEEDFRPVLAKALVLHKQGQDGEAKPLLESAYSLAPSQFKDQINQLFPKAKSDEVLAMLQRLTEYVEAFETLKTLKLY